MSDAGTAPAPSPWFERWRPAWQAAAREAPVLDLASGRGRHARVTAAAGFVTVALDRDREALARLPPHPGVLFPVRADAEAGPALPFGDGRFGVVLVFRYLHRALATEIERCLAPGGLLLYETFTQPQADEPWGPSNPAFLLEPGELPRLFAGLGVEGYEEGCRESGRSEWVASLAARRPR